MPVNLYTCSHAPHAKGNVHLCFILQSSLRTILVMSCQPSCSPQARRGLPPQHIQCSTQCTSCTECSKLSPVGCPAELSGL